MLTIEASGIGIAAVVASELNVPVVFAKKSMSINLDYDNYKTQIQSFTHKKIYNVIVSKKFLTPEDHVLIIDDFLANGCALMGLLELAEEAGATVEGIGIAVKNDAGEWTLLNGNQTNIIFTEYIIRRKKELNQLKGGEYTVKTIVTTELIKDIAEKNHIICYDVYTGFKWIADIIRKEGGEKFIGGGEESFGYMPGAFTRDKYGVSATSLMAEIAAWVKMQNKTLYSFLKEIYAKYGFSQERMIYIVRKGLSGAQEIKAMMEEFRHNTPKEINHSPVVLKKDYLSLEATNLQTGEKTHLDFETKSDVLQFFLADGSKISVRPSGTEPKIKFYFEARTQMKDINDYERAQQEANARIDAIIKDLKLQ